MREAHHTLAVMHFNGSGGRRRDKDPEAGAALCARGTFLFDCVSAKRELGHCLQDGFGVERDAALGAKLLDEAAAADAKSGKGLDAAVLAASAAAAIVEERLRKRNDINTLNAAVAAAAEVAAAAKNAAAAHLTATRENRFLLDWYGDGAASDPAKKPEGPRDAADGDHLVLAPPVRARRDSPARVPEVLVLRARAVLQPLVPGRGLEAAAQVRVSPAARAVRLVGVRRRVRRRRGTRRG